MLVLSIQLCALVPSVYTGGWERMGGGGVLNHVGDHILQEFNILYLTRLRTYRIARPPQTKTWEGRWPQKDKQLPQSPFTGHFFDDDILL
jgi:hypothetical protein